MIKFCRKCQVETERDKHGTCKACQKAYGITHSEQKKSYLVTYGAAYRIANREKEHKRGAAWRESNKDRIKVNRAVYLIASKDKLREITAAYRITHHDSRVAYNKKWASDNPEFRRITQQNRRAKKSANGGVLSKGLSVKLFKLQRGKCACCGKPLGADFHLDHILPVDLGGPNIDSNIQLLTANCNQKKHTKHPIDFMQQKGYLL